jgi:hypothetical protein
VFSFLRRKRTLTDEQKFDLIRSFVGMLEVQLVLVPETDRRLKDEAGNFRKKALGYVLGWIDAVLTMMGQSVGDASVALPIAFQVLKRLFPGEDPSKTLDYFLANQSDATITLGMMTGGQQVVDYGKGKWKGGGGPMGLARFLLKGDGSA